MSERDREFINFPPKYSFKSSEDFTVSSGLFCKSDSYFIYLQNITFPVLSQKEIKKKEKEITHPNPHSFYKHKFALDMLRTYVETSQN